MQKYRSPAVELYGSAGTMQLMGDDWAPNGFEQWTNDRGSWEIVGETDPQWPWTDGLRHLVECVEKGIRAVTRPEHAFHAFEVMLAAKRSSEEGRVVEVHSTFPDFDYGAPAVADADGRGEHDPRSS